MVTEKNEVNCEKLPFFIECCHGNQFPKFISIAFNNNCIKVKIFTGNLKLIS